MKKIIFLFLALMVGWTARAQAPQSDLVREDAPNEYRSPSSYAAASIIPGLGQFLLDEPKKGTRLVILNVVSIAASAGGYTAVALRERPAGEPQRNQTVTALCGVLAVAGTVGWLGTEVYSIVDAYKTAKQKRGELTLAVSIVPGSNVPGIGIAYRF